MFSIFKKKKEKKPNCEHDYIFLTNRILGMRTNKVLGACRKCGDNVEFTYNEYRLYLEELEGKENGS